MAANDKGETSADARLLTRVTAVLTALVALNTLVISCAQRRDGEQRAELAQANDQVQYWESAMRDLDHLLQDRPPLAQIEAAASLRGEARNTPAPELADAQNWLGRCRLLSQRTIQIEVASQQAALSGAGTGQAGEQDESPSARVAGLLDRAHRLRGSFRAQMQDGAIVGSACAQLDARTEQEVEARERIQIAAVRSEPETNTRPIDEAVSLAFLGNEANIGMNRSEIDTSGYDVDVFWCDRLDQPEAVRENIVQAANFARRLSNMADAGERIEGQRLGRIRLRRLSVATQALGDGPGYPSSGVQFRFDQGQETERELARAMASEVDGARPRPQGSASPFYISGFFCAAGTFTGDVAPE